MSLSPSAPQCRNCIYSLKAEAPKSGVVDLSQVKSPPLLCRRYPPQAAALPTHQGVAVITVDYPQTAPDSWCGEHAYATA